MQFDHRCADGLRGLDLIAIRRDEQRHADAGIAQSPDRIFDQAALTDHVEPAFRGPLGAPFRHQAGRMRTGPQRDRDHVVGRRHLEIQRLVDLGLEPRDIVVADVPAVLAQMRRDPVRARGDGQPGRAHRIGMPAAARVSNGRDMVDIHTKPEMRCVHKALALNRSRAPRSRPRASPAIAR